MIPVLCDMYFQRALPVKHAAIRTLLLLLRKIKRFNQREEICDKLVYGKFLVSLPISLQTGVDLRYSCPKTCCHSFAEFGQAKSFYLRSLFVTICQQVIELFSRQFFKGHMFEAVIDLTSDTVPNIRLRVCPLLPKLKVIGRFFSERDSLFVSLFIFREWIGRQDCLASGKNFSVIYVSCVCVKLKSESNARRLTPLTFE